jgi:hypothetical protein
MRSNIMTEQRSATQKMDGLKKTIVEAHYLALALRQLALDENFLDQRAAELVAELLHGWAKRQNERIEEGRVCFREIRLVVEPRQTDVDTRRAQQRH